MCLSSTFKIFRVLDKKDTSVLFIYLFWDKSRNTIQMSSRGSVLSEILDCGRRQRAKRGLLSQEVGKQRDFQQNQVTPCSPLAGSWTLCSVTWPGTLRKEQSTSRCWWMCLLPSSAAQRTCICGTSTSLFPPWWAFALRWASLQKGLVRLGLWLSVLY